MSDFVIENGYLSRYTGDEKKVIVPEGVVTIGFNAFADCMELEEVVLPQSLKRIREYAFQCCFHLKKVDLPEGLEQLDARVFWKCRRLEKIIIPKDLYWLGSDVIFGCTGMKWIENHSKHRLLSAMEPEKGACGCVDGGFLPHEDLAAMKPYYKAWAAACYLSNPDRYDIQAQEIYSAYIRKQASSLLGKFAAADATDSVARLLETGFVKPDAIQKAMKEAEGKVAITAMLMAKLGPEGTQKKKSAVEMLELPSLETSEKELKKLWATKVLPDGTLEIAGYNGSENFVTVPAQIGECIISAIGEKALSPLKNCKNKEHRAVGILRVELPQTITRIDKKAFAGCAAMTEILLGDSVAELGEGVFASCNSLTTVTLPSKLEKMGKDAFHSCSSLQEVKIPESLKRIETHTFYECTALIRAELHAEITDVGTCAFSRCDQITELTIPKAMKKIGQYAFEEMHGLTELTVPGKVKSIGQCAFSGCEGLQRVVLAEGVKKLSAQAFGGCSGLKEVVMPASLTDIDTQAFMLYSIGYKLAFTIKAPAGSYAETYAKENNIPFEAI